MIRVHASENQKNMKPWKGAGLLSTASFPLRVSEIQPNMPEAWRQTGWAGWGEEDGGEEACKRKVFFQTPSWKHGEKRDAAVEKKSLNGEEDGRKV